jgi:hypothetical protein
MLLVRSILLLIAPLFIAANETSTTTSTAAAATQSIQVGAVSLLELFCCICADVTTQVGLSFTPTSITANVGDTIGIIRSRTTSSISDKEQNSDFTPKTIP